MVNINSGFKVTCDIIVTGNTMLLATIIMFEMEAVTTVTIRVNIEYVET